MNLKLFVLYTSIGGTIWCAILITLGYVIGENEFLIKKYLKQFNLIFILSTGALIIYYIWKRRQNKKTKWIRVDLKQIEYLFGALGNKIRLISTL